MIEQPEWSWFKYFPSLSLLAWPRSILWCLVPSCTVPPCALCWPTYLPVLFLCLPPMHYIPFFLTCTPQSDLNTQDSGPFGTIGGGSTCVNNVCFPSQVKSRHVRSSWKWVSGTVWRHPSLSITHDPTFEIALSHAYCNHAVRLPPIDDWLFVVTPVSTPACRYVMSICPLVLSVR